MNIRYFLKKATKMLSHCDNPRYEAEILLSHVLKCTRVSIIINDEIILSKKQCKKLNNFIYRRSIGEPIAYIIGKKEFWSLSLCVSYKTLIPRPDTEILVERVLSRMNKNFESILDLGTGSGAIALALASICSNWDITGVDNSNEALKIANINALKLNLENVRFFYSDWFSHINKKFHIIVSNPPYVSIKEINLLKKDLFYEPFNALISKKDGLLDIELIIQQARQHLFYKGWLLIEHGWKQKLKVQFLFKKYNFFYIESFKDYGGNDRITLGQKK
ncbi:peptide chain release factor N(5)-glutamine methyltransferase [Buchnera aphidicola]|uniref:Release factor glutamine methyltransferase n=1 Tax=Buchnera aphidicola subsp. Rhopalosiphum maidis TaxID=118109 RepID=A0A3G2I6R5_BUCRM|nr:peptide chain release factor N(5)-glutamine methyltransferase [Buchnera aphidicola]AYN24871.1 peptide chain release factor N(5)-glutamine methyltransferase [Buchnera aphidicola (Rhopalosiphum maidis)]